MNKINYRISVNINDENMKLGFRATIPEEYYDRKIRVQAIFSQRQVERRFPMQIQILDDELGKNIVADAQIQLPHVFLNSPRHKVNVTFSLWAGMEEIRLEDQPFPVQKEMFQRPERFISRNFAKFIIGTIALPYFLIKSWANIKDFKLSLKAANADVYAFSGYSYSRRQRKTDYFAIQYEKFIKQCKVKENRVLFLSERLPEKGGNLALIKEVYDQDPDIDVTDFIVTKTVDNLTSKEIKVCAELCAQAKVIILEDFYPQIHSLKLRKETKIVQLWHACGAFKTFGFTRLGKPGGAPQNSLNHRNYDFVPVSSKSICGIYAEAFGISASKVKALGVPRTDILFNEDYKKKKREELYMKYPGMAGKKVILFAPTFRGNGNKDAYYPEEAFDVNSFMKNMAEDVICIVKHHPFVHQVMEVDDLYKERVYDLTGKDHINDLLMITDLMITDYSSVVFEATILNVPMIFYAFDKKLYIESRDFYCDFDNFAPGYIAQDFSTMIVKVHAVLSKNTEETSELILRAKKRQFIRDFLSALDGNSTQRIASVIKDKYIKLT